MAEPGLESEAEVGLGVAAEDPNAAADCMVSQLRRYVVEHHDVHIIAMRNSDQVGVQRQGEAGTVLSIGQDLTIEQHGDIDIAVAVRGASGLAAE